MWKGNDKSNNTPESFTVKCRVSADRLDRDLKTDKHRKKKN